MGTEEPQVKVGYLQLSEAEKKVADAAVEQAKTFLVSGFKDQLSELRKEWEKETDPSTRPGFAGSAADASNGIDFTERFGSMKRAVVDRSTNKTIGWKDIGSLQSGALPANQAAGESRGGWLPPLQMGADDRQLLAQDFGKFVDDLASKSDPKSGVSFNQLKFPRGDIENFSIARWAMATERAQNTAEGTAAYNKWAPYETAYYAALEAYSTTKAQGDMATGQDGGFLY